MKIAILVHGYNVVNPEKTVGKLREPFEEAGYIVESLNYGFVPFVWQLKKRNPKVAARLAKRIRYWDSSEHVEKIIIVGHSNGCAVMHLTSAMVDFIPDCTVVVNPSLRKEENPYPQCDRVFVMHNGGDNVVVSGKWLSKISAWLRFGWLKPIPWGEMGNTGYTGDAVGVVNIDTSRGLKTALGHSGVFTGEHSNYFLKKIVNLCEG